MDSLIAAAARALVAGDALGALKRVALRDDPPALALRGIAMAQLGELPRARELLRLAARTFGTHEELARARCVVAEAEVALAMRDLRRSSHGLAAATAALDARDDHTNALHARLIEVRRLILLGRIDEAASALARLDTQDIPPSLLAVVELAHAEVALRSLRTAPARAALERAREAAKLARVPALLAEVVETAATLDRPAARRFEAGQEKFLRLDEVEALLASGVLVVDACRRRVQRRDTSLSLARRPVLFELMHALAAAWPEDVDRNELIAHAFRALVAPLASIEASARGFALVPRDKRHVVLLLPPIDGDQAALQALLADGEAWSTSALALALNSSQRTVQRALAELEATGRVRSIGRARARRWLAPPLAKFTTNLLLPATLPPG